MKKEILLDTLLFVGGVVVAYKGLEYFVRKSKIKKDYIQVPIEVVLEKETNNELEKVKK